jgi:DNA-binding CsgD family transcriptional regulator
MPNVTLLETNRCGVLSRREREVARLVAQGLRDRQISDELYISEHTVRSHISRIIGKTGLRGRMQLAVYAVDFSASQPPRTPKLE